MVVYMSKWDICPDSKAAYRAWAAGALKKMMAVPGLREFRAFRPVTGDSEVVLLYEFDDMAAFAEWYDRPEVRELFEDARQFTENVRAELWGPSPVAPQPLRT